MIQYSVFLRVGIAALMMLALFSFPVPIQAQNQPDLVSLSKTTVINDADSEVILSGSLFEDPPVVTVGTQQLARVTWLSASEVKIIIPQSFPAGIYSVTLANPGGLSDTLDNALTVYNPTPSISSVFPSEILNDSNSRLTITGTGFVSGTAIFVENTALADVTYVSPEQIEALLPWGWDAGAYDLQVVNPGPGSPTGTLSSAVKVTSAFGVWTNKGPYGGIAQGIYVDPENENIVLASMSSTGIFRTEDGGAGWQKVSAQPPTALMFAPSNPDIIYSTYWMLQKSVDGGLTWNFPDTSNMNFSWTTTLLVHPTNPNLVYAGIQDRVDNNPGFFRSTDGGLSWTRMETDMAHHSIAGAVLHPDDSQRIIAVTTDGYVYESIDGAAHWIERGKPVEAFTTLAIDPFGNHDVWAGQCHADQSKIHGIIKASLADLVAWQSIATTEAAYSCVPMKTVFDPVQSGTIYVTSNTRGDKTIDGGQNWQTGLAGGIQLMDFVISKTNHTTVYASHWGKGIIKSLDGGATWTKINQGLAAVVPSAIAVAAENPDEVYVGSNPYGLYWSESGGHTWLERGEYNGTVSLSTDPFIPGRVYSSVWNGIKFSADRGETWTMAAIDTTPPDWCPATVCTGGAESLGVAADPSTPGKILAGIGYHFDPPSVQSWPGGIYISTDYGASFTPVEYDVPRGAMEVFAFAPTAPNIVYAAGYGGILRSENGGQNWVDITPAGVPKGQFTNVVVHPADPQMIFTTFYSADIGGVYRSTDGGTSWQRIAPIMGWTLAAQGSANQPFILYLGGMDGLWSSTDHGLTWTRAAGDLGYANITKLASAADAKRNILYVGAAGGVSAPNSPGFISPSSSTSSGGNAGLYRKTQPVLDHQLFLPAVSRK